MDAPGEEWTILRLLDWTRKHFAGADVEEPRLSAEMLLAHVLGCPRMKLYSQFEHVVSPEHRAAFRELIRRAAAGEPVAYLTGEREFYSLAFAVTPDVLIPRPETELLVDAALAAAKEAGGAARLWDVCTGSGCVAVAAAKYAEQLSVLATDVSEAAVAVATGNVARHELTGRVLVAQADLLSLPGEAAEMSPFDVITANPPYVSDADMATLPPQVLREPELALRAGPTGLEFIGPIIAGAAEHLRPGGVLAVEIGFDQAEAVYDLLGQAGHYQQIELRKDAAGIERAAVARRR